MSLLDAAGSAVLYAAMAWLLFCVGAIAWALGCTAWEAALEWRQARLARQRVELRDTALRVAEELAIERNAVSREMARVASLVYRQMPPTL